LPEALPFKDTVLRRQDIGERLSLTQIKAATHQSEES
jgi:hypothetical protein